MTAAGLWPGCHGVRLGGDALDLGAASGEPICEASVRFGRVRPPEGAELWTQHGNVVVDGTEFSVDRVLHERSDGALVLTGTGEVSLEVDQKTATITVDDGDAGVQAQLVATFGLPMILHTTDALVLHGSACALDDRTIVVCGHSGSGKSTLLVGLADAGWAPVTEDLCAVDFRGPAPVVWPGPPWVRIGRGSSGPAGSALRFDSAYKTGWDIATSQTTAPRPITHVVLLEPPGGEHPSLEPVDPPTAIRELAPHGVWLGDQDERGRRLFGPTADLVARVPTLRLRLPHSDSWLDEVAPFLVSRL